MCEIDLDEVAAVWAQEWHRCRKEKSCCTCGAAILRGEAYLRTASLFDGSWSTAFQCALCGHVQLRFGHEHGTQPFPTELWEYLRSCVDDSLFPHRGGEPRGHEPWFLKAKVEGREWRTYIGWIKRRSRLTSRRVA